MTTWKPLSVGDGEIGAEVEHRWCPRLDSRPACRLPGDGCARGLGARCRVQRRGVQRLPRRPWSWARAGPRARRTAGRSARSLRARRQHSDRFARGDGIQAQHLAELWFASRRAGVELHSVQDDSTFTNPLLAVALGERNAEDSRRKALAVKAGMARRRVKGLVNGRAPIG